MADPYMTLITALLSGLLGGIIALISVFLTNRGHTTRLAMQFENDAGKRKEDLLRARGEELYELTDTWLNALFSYHTSTSFVIDERITYNEALDLQVKQGEKQAGNFARIEMLIDVYFPEARKTYDDLIVGRDKVNAIMIEHKRAYQDGILDKKRFLPPFKERQLEVLQAGKKLKTEILVCIRSI
jgi:hypothetical protein